MRVKPFLCRRMFKPDLQTVLDVVDRQSFPVIRGCFSFRRCVNETPEVVLIAVRI